MLTYLKEQVLHANRSLERSNLVRLTWGNVSGLHRASGLVVIKPSGVPYAKLETEDLVVLDLEGNQLEGELNPSSDTPTHLELYRAFPELGGITHVHSPYATAFAQSRREIPCLGTTHADYFFGSVPLTRILTPEEVAAGYELNTGKVIIERLEGIEPLEMPAVLVAHHGPFAWGKDPMASLETAIALETVAEMALATLQIDPKAKTMPEHILNKHYTRKHGPDAYYGQPIPNEERDESQTGMHRLPIQTGTQHSQTGDRRQPTTTEHPHRTH